jgi:hypothetical protein
VYNKLDKKFENFNIIKIEWQQVHLKLIGQYDVQTIVAQLLIFSHNHPMVFFSKMDISINYQYQCQKEFGSQLYYQYFLGLIIDYA